METQLLPKIGQKRALKPKFDPRLDCKWVMLPKYHPGLGRKPKFHLEVVYKSVPLPNFDSRLGFDRLLCTIFTQNWDL